MDRPTLPIDSMSDQDFQRFKEEHLDNPGPCADRRLNERDLKAIAKLFRLGDPDIASVCCDDYHGHSYRCLTYNHPASGVVERLIDEIKAYRGAIKTFAEKVRDALPKS